MGLRDRFEGFKRKYFGSFSPTTIPTDKPVAVKQLTNNLVTWLLGQSDFASMDEEDITEQLYLYEAEIGGAVDRTSTMVGESFKGFCLKEGDTDVKGLVSAASDGSFSEPISSANVNLEKEMVAQANIISDSIDIRNYFEMFSEILAIKGNLYLLKDKNNLTLTVLPNKYVTILDRMDRVNSGQKNQYDFIMQENFLVLFEGTPGSQQQYKAGDFIHIKYKSTPIFENDSKGRPTFGIYSVSPLNRVVIPVWWKRQSMVLDMLVRQMHVPREHHMIDSKMFNLNLYSGTPEQKLEKATAAIKTFIESYASDLAGKTPEQGYVTLDTTKIETINESRSGLSYLKTNELITQINEQIWTALNMPKSIVNGESTGSYASELIIANYVTQKILQISNKIKPVILNNMRERLLLINNGYPVDKLDIKLDLDIASTEIEKMRKMAIMGQLGIFTETELRDMDNYGPLTDDQRKELVKTGSGAFGSGTQVPTHANMGTGAPETPQSSVQHSNDASTSATRSDKLPA